MAFTQTDVDALDTAFKTGASSMRKADGSEITWRSVDEYFKLRALMVDGIASDAGSAATLCTITSYSRD